ncbi:hypothetical protein Sjap_005174 [Stephania japonica]|uniref:Uncharacterized protein n=1 Tax=Stephania japonica TaxID=461633 RepID=A0AAP0PLL2_9MAGN
MLLSNPSHPFVVFYKLEREERKRRHPNQREVISFPHFSSSFFLFFFFFVG